MKYSECCTINALKRQLAECREALAESVALNDPRLVVAGHGLSPTSQVTLNTVGADFLVVAGHSGLPVYGAVTDNYGNTYTYIEQVLNDSLRAWVMYCSNPITGPNHTFSHLGGAYSDVISVAAFANMGVNALDDYANNQINSTPQSSQITAGPVNPTTTSTLVIGFLGASQVTATAHAASVDNGMIIADLITENVAGIYSALAYKVMHTTDSTTIKWTTPEPNDGMLAQVTAFKYGL